MKKLGKTADFMMTMRFGRQLVKPLLLIPNRVHEDVLSVNVVCDDWRNVF
jgi:hypothetical protein